MEQNEETKNKKLSLRKRIIILLFIIIIVAGVGGGWFYVNKYDDWRMAKWAKNHEQGEKYLSDYRFAVSKIRDNPEDSDAYNIIGFVKAEFKDYQGAEKAYIKSLIIDGDNVPAMKGLSYVYVKTQNFSEAEKYYLKILDMEPKIIDNYYNLVSLYHDYYKEKAGETEGILLRGLEVLPNNENLLSILASYYREIGEIKKALPIYRQILSLRPNDNILRAEVERLERE